ncbi:MAG: hypothetical protein MHM6MM_006611 [Cercozoa sp. M6MM]
MTVSRAAYIRAKTARQAQTEAYGFVLWVGSAICFGIFLVWSFTPDHVLVQYGISYFPDKYWAIAIPTWLCVAFVASIFLYSFYSLSGTHPLDSACALSDQFARQPAPRPSGQVDWCDALTYLTMKKFLVGDTDDNGKLHQRPIPEISDLPIELVNELMLGHSSPRRRVPERTVEPNCTREDTVATHSVTRDSGEFGLGDLGVSLADDFADEYGKYSANEHDVSLLSLNDTHDTLPDLD